MTSNYLCRNGTRFLKGSCSWPECRVSLAKNVNCITERNALVAALALPFVDNTRLSSPSELKNWISSVLRGSGGPQVAETGGNRWETGVYCGCRWRKDSGNIYLYIGCDYWV
jgi:hypothetical protein